jgi:predicted ATPase
VSQGGFLQKLELRRELVTSFAEYPFSIPSIASLAEIELELDPRVTFLVGENGSGKSTLIEAIAVSERYNAEGGTRNFNFATRRSESELHKAIRISKGARRPRDGFFLRAESYYNVASEAERLGVTDAYGGSAHEQSQGESFLALAMHRFGPQGLYILDEPEAALSPQRQLSLMAIMHRLLREGSQFIIATHSPILMAFPGALIYQLSAGGIERIAYADAEHVRITRDFLANPERFFKSLFADDD